MSEVTTLPTDGYADALLGELAYRVMLECKLARDDTVSQSNAVPEAAKYRDTYNADYCALVAPSFDAEVTFVSELRARGRGVERRRSRSRRDPRSRRLANA